MDLQQRVEPVGTSHFFSCRKKAFAFFLKAQAKAAEYGFDPQAMMWKVVTKE